MANAHAHTYIDFSFLLTLLLLSPFFFFLESKRLGIYLIGDPEFNDAKKKEEKNIRTPHLPFSLESKVGESCVFPNLSIPIVILQVSSC